MKVRTNMFFTMRNFCAFSFLMVFSIFLLPAQKLLPFKLPDSGQNSGYTSTSGEDADFYINPMSFTDNADGTITDNNTGLMWQKTDGGEMTFGKALIYCQNLRLAGYSDWRLPTSHELFSINKMDANNPAINTVYFTQTTAEYWWTAELRADDTSKVWAVNAGGGIGAHPKSETVSAGGLKKFHVRAVRNPYATVFSQNHFTDNGNGTITDNYTGLTWQKIQPLNSMTWEEALAYASSLSLAGHSGWRLPNIKELQSLNDEKLFKPSFNKQFFTQLSSGNFWSSTTLYLVSAKAWDINVDYGIVSYSDKTIKENVLCVSGGNDNNSLNIHENVIAGGTFQMGDHFGFVDPGHPSDETPIHTVNLDSFIMGKTETTNQQFLAFLNSALLDGLIEVKNNIVYNASDTNILFYTNQYASFYSIGFDGKVFSIADFRANHPVVGVMWCGAATYCNWLSLLNGLNPSYNLKTWTCDFTKNGYRLPTEAEWEYAGRGGHLNPYFNYPNGDSIDVKQANLPNSADPYESGNYPLTTPVGFYDGNLKLKSDFNWPSAASTYQTDNGINGFGLYDMQGNVWEFVNDLYGQNYYSSSPQDNPKGPVSGFLMPDGKPYHGMRGGNWYNGLVTAGKSDGHSRVSNRNPSYYRGPQDPNHPYYHLGFRTSRNYDPATLSVVENGNLTKPGIDLYQNFPNPFSDQTVIKFSISEENMVSLKIFDAYGKEVKTLLSGKMKPAVYELVVDGNLYKNGVFYYQLQVGSVSKVKQMILIK